MTARFKTSINSFQILLNTENEKLKIAERKLGAAKAEVSKGLNRLDMLKSYQSDYDKNQNVVKSNGFTMAQLKNFQNFASKLQHAIDGQQSEIKASENLVEVCLKNWQEIKKTCLSYEAIIKSNQQKLKAVDDKREQKLMDEFSSKSRTIAFQ